MSDMDNTASKMSEAGATSWNDDDTDDDVQPKQVGTPFIYTMMFGFCGSS